VAAFQLERSKHSSPFVLFKTSLKIHVIFKWQQHSSVKTCCHGFYSLIYAFQTPLHFCSSALLPCWDCGSQLLLQQTPSEIYINTLASQLKPIAFSIRCSRTQPQWILPLKAVAFKIPLVPGFVPLPSNCTQPDSNTDL